MKASLLVLGLFVSVSACVSAAAVRAPSAGAPEIGVFESGPEGFNTKTYFYDNGEEVVVIDAQFTPELAEQFLRTIRTKTSSPVTSVILTHPNPDKFNGAPVFQKIGAKVISSQATADAIPGVYAYKAAYFVDVAKMFKFFPPQAKVDVTFTGQRVLRLRNGEEIELRELARPGVSSTQTVVSIPRAGALFVGDLVHSKAHAWLEGGIVNGKPTPDLAGWIADLKELSGLYPAGTTVYGGRGGAGLLSSVVPEQIAYLQTADRLVSDRLKTLPNFKDLKRGKTKMSADQSQAVFKDLQSDFERRFPDYSLGYMIQYGVYGLVMSKF